MPTNSHLPNYRTIITVLIIVSAIAFFIISPKRKEPFPEYIRSYPIFGTTARIKLWHTPKSDAANKSLRKVKSYLQQLNNTINVFDPESELSRLNATAYEQPFECSDMLWEILQAARKAYYQTDGNFDVTVGPLIDLWGFYDERDQWPSEEEIEKAANKTGLDKVKFDHEQQSVRFTLPEMSIDLGGIAKGYAIDKTGEILKKHGIRYALIEIGGEILTLEHPEESQGYRIGIRNPKDRKHYLAEIKTENKGIATSGDYENYREFNGRIVSHIINPKTGMPVENILSVTVIAPTCLEAEIQATSLAVGGLDAAQDYIQEKGKSRQVVFAQRTENNEIEIKFIPEKTDNSPLIFSDSLPGEQLNDSP